MDTNEQVVEETSNVDEPTTDDSQEVETKTEEVEDATDWKAEAEKWKGIAKRNQTKAEKSKETPAIDNKNNKQKDIDYGHLTFHNSKSDIKITDEEDIDYVKEMMEESGLDQKTLLSKKWFQSEITSN